MYTCTACGAQLPSQAHFCGICGTPFRPLLPPNDLPQRLATIQSAPQRPELPAIPDIKTRPPLPISTAPTRFSQASSGQLATGHTYPSGPMPVYTNQAHDIKATPETARKRGCGWLALSLIAIVVVMAGASGMMAYLLTRPHPQPVISVSSTYTVGAIPAGSQGTVLHVRGQKFSDSSAITFLLDGHAAPGAPRVFSDQNGNLSATLPITAAWEPGQHLFAARDAAHFISKRGIAIEVVVPGQANTPGPNGAPPDDASFSMNVSQNTPVQEQYNGDTGPLANADPLAITGQGSPAGGNVCKARDNGQPQTYNGTTANGLADTQVATFSCKGTYKSGQIAYTETLLSDDVTVNYQGNSYVCHLLTPGVDEQLSGSYTTSGNFSGTITYASFPQADFSCTTGQLVYFNFSLTGGNGTWTATDTRS